MWKPIQITKFSDTINLAILYFMKLNLVILLIYQLNSDVIN